GEPGCATVIGNKDPSPRTRRGPARSNHPVGDLRRRLAVGADAPDHAVRTVRHDDITTGREQIARRISVWQHGTNAVDPVASGPVQKRPPRADGMGPGVNGDDPVATLL